MEVSKIILPLGVLNTKTLRFGQVSAIFCILLKTSLVNLIS